MEKLTKLGDPLQRLSEYIDWKIFEGPLNEAYKDEDKNMSKGGRPPFGRLMMFKALLIQSLYNLSDDQLEYQIVDRASFKRFLGLKKSDKVPDSKTFWVFREHLIEKEVIEGLFTIFNETLEQKASNKEKSRTRVRVEHIFGFVENSMNSSIVRTIGLPRAKAKIGMMNLTYNICRCVQLRLVVAFGE